MLRNTTCVIIQIYIHTIIKTDRRFSLLPRTMKIYYLIPEIQIFFITTYVMFKNCLHFPLL